MADTGFWVVGVTATCKRLAICATQQQAEEYCGELPGVEHGGYYIDGPCTEPITLDEPTIDEVPENAADGTYGGARKP
jgi:hypothetical protein